MSQLAEIIGVLERESHSKTQMPEFKANVSNKPVFPIFQKLAMNPMLHLKKEGAFRPANVILIGALVGIGILGFFLMRQFQLRQETLAQLSRVETERSNLEQAVADLRAELEKQREDILKLTADLEAASAKAAMVDTLQESHRTELSRVTKLYEGELQSLQGALKSRDSLIKSLESNLEGVRKLFERGSAAAPSAASAGLPSSREASVGPFPAQGIPSAKVMMVNQANRFVIVDLGPAAGAGIGRFLQIYHGGKSIGQARIERVYQTLSAATVLSDDTLERVQAGDTVYLALA